MLSTTTRVLPGALVAAAPALSHLVSTVAAALHTSATDLQQHRQHKPKADDFKLPLGGVPRTMSSAAREWHDR